MVVIRVDNRPIAFSGQTASYGAGIQNLINERIFTDTALRVNTVANPNPLTDHLYDNLATGAFPRRDKINTTDNKVEVDSTDGIYSPKV